MGSDSRCWLERRPASDGPTLFAGSARTCVATVATGESCRKVAETYRVSVASVVKWSQRFRSTGSAAAKRMGGNQPRSLAPERDWVLARLAESPDLTLRALVDEAITHRKRDPYHRTILGGLIHRTRGRSFFSPCGCQYPLRRK
jgi:transposase